MLLHQGQQVAHKALGGPACGDGEGGGGRGLVHEVQGPEQVTLQGAEHTHAVLQLPVALVVVLPGKLSPGPEKKLVRTEEAPCAEAAQIFLTELVGNVQNFSGAPGVHGLQLCQTLSVFGDAHGHQGAGGELHLRQVPEGAAKLVAVVPAGTDHDLPVHHDARLTEGTNIVQAAHGIFVSQHGTVELGVRGVNGDIDGADAQVNDALSLPLREIGEGDIVALEEAEPGIIVLKV